MKKVILPGIFCIFITISFAQKETFDLVTYTPPKGWKKQIKETLINYSIVDNKDKAWCQIGIIRSTVSKGSIESDFESEWNELAAKQYAATETPQTTGVQEADGWQMKTGTGKFLFNKKDAAVMLTTFSGYGVCISILATTGNQRYLKNIEAMIGSIKLKKPATNKQAAQVQSNDKKNNSVSNGFAFTTTNFDDGWTSTVQEDWIEVIKGNIKVLIHYPNKKADAYNSVVMDGLKNAWNILVAPRYSSASNFEFKPITGWQTIEFAEADMVEKITGKTVHVVFFKMNYSNGSGKYLEFITTTKNSFEQEFGAYHQTTSGWEKMESMANYNKFAVGVSDLQGKWTSDFSGAIQYVNAYTGFDAGMDTHASNENFNIGAGNTYNWDLGVASGQVGNIKFQSKKSNGKLTMTGNWKVNFSDIEGRPRSYDVYFSCIKGLRILWLDNRPFAKKE